jgi:hypothetical protein
MSVLMNTAFTLAQSRLLCASYQRLTGKPLMSDLQARQADDVQLAETLYRAEVAIVSHDTAADPVFNYANLQAQVLFGYDWDSFVRLPSRLSAEPLLRDARAALLARVSRDGFVDDYSGIRIARDGRRFMITRATVWNLHDDAGGYHGQAACIHDWYLL